MLQITNLTKSFPNRGIVLNGLNLSVEEGDSVSISGPSGSGKTTLLNIIGLLDAPDKGEIIFRGDRILGYNPGQSASYRNKNIGFIFQDHLLLPYLTVKENILMPLMASGSTENDHMKRVANAMGLMERLGIADLSDKYPFTISGGEAQRVALVRALVNQPSLLLADEPTGSLDSKNAENLGDILTELNKEAGITVILATHSSSLARKMKRKLKLSEGSLSPDENF